MNDKCVFCGCVLLITTLWGCGENDPWPRVPIGGNVTVGGSQTFDGSITFLPAEGTSGPSATATVTGGSYQFQPSNGPVAGPHRVIIMPKEGPAQPPTPQAAGSKDSAGGPTVASQPAATFRRMETTVTVPQEADQPLDIQFSQNQS